VLWSELAHTLPAGAEYETPGTIWLASDDAEMAEAGRKLTYYRDRGVRTQLLNARELADIEPNIRSGLAGGLLVSEDAVIYPPTAALYLAHVARDLGADLLCGRGVVEIGHGRVLLEDGQELSARCAINATGAWAPELGAEIPVKKRKGHLAITDRYPGYVRHQLVELGYLKSAHSAASDSVAFNVQPRKTGQLLIGSSRQYGDETSSVDQAILSAMLQRAAVYMPSIGSLNVVRVWTGFRAATPDKLPLIGPSMRDDSVWMATGHEGLGITTSLATGALIAAALTGRQSSIPLGPYLPSRFKPHKNPADAAKEPLCNGEA
jgi:D-hydroxyproline dehydrogenase subunit beta